MTKKLNCQKCNQDTAVELCFDEDIDAQVYNCEHCGGRHVEVEITTPSGGHAVSRFRLDEDD
ncbi:hypothetical protein [Pseudomonas akapageensis]|uniref:hypothetical protein n=1 Tax=Pseudomonas akapageensis TaxID=2609961 RepID=UPI00140A96D7|nr:hypothetical protein [Pseudomonas akapageensis]